MIFRFARLLLALVCAFSAYAPGVSANVAESQNETLSIQCLGVRCEKEPDASSWHCAVDPAQYGNLSSGSSKPSPGAQIHSSDPIVSARENVSLWRTGRSTRFCSQAPVWNFAERYVGSVKIQS